MIVFDLKCDKNHRFEAWFRSSAAFEDQCAGGAIECPYCGSVEIAKAPMAPNVGAKGNRKPAPQMPMVPVASAEADGRLAELAAEVRDVMERFRAHVEDNCEYVGAHFAEEARKIHYGEAEERGIFGETTLDESRSLIEEGIEILPLPATRRTDA